MTCYKCGGFIHDSAGYCKHCGTWVTDATDSNRDIENQVTRVKQHASSIPFVLGCMLITVSMISSVVLNQSWEIWLGAAFALVHIIALWMLAVESIASKTSTKATLTALTMFKISAILSMIYVIIIFGILGLFLLLATLRGITFLLLIALVGGFAYVFIKYYFLALLSILDDIRRRIIHNKYSPLERLGPFLLISYLAFGIAAIVALLQGIIPALPNLLSYAGMLLCLRTLTHFSE